MSLRTLRIAAGAVLALLVYATTATPAAAAAPRREADPAQAAAPAPLVSGDPIFGPGGQRCTIGFNGRDAAGTTFVITGGRCTQGGGTFSGGNGVVIGPVVTTAWPGDDFGLIRVDNTAAWQGSSQVRGGGSVLGSTVAPVGASVCRFSPADGYRCGTVQSLNNTINHGGGAVVHGLTRTNICATSGDSGAPYVSGRQAQGLGAGGSGNCSSGGTSFFQPINEALSRHGLSLIVG